MASLLKNILLGKQYIGIEFFSLDNEEKIAFLQAERKKNEIVITKSHVFNNKEKLIAEKDKAPAVLIINNSQVLQKEVSTIDPNDRKLLHKAFPNLQFEEFYYEIWRKDSISLVSICRKNYVDELCNSLKDSFKITSVSLGISSLSNIVSITSLSLLTTNTQIIDLSRHENIVQSGNIIPAKMDLNGLQISNEYLLGFSGLLKLILSDSTTGTIQDLNLQLLENFQQNSFFQKTLKTGIIILISILLINFFLFSYYFDKVNQAEAAISLNSAGIKNIIKIKDRIKTKEGALKNFTANNVSRSSVVINAIVRQIPSTILLSQIDYHPLEKKIKAEEPLLSLNNLIYISGNTISNEDFTNWVEDLGGQDGIKDVTIVSFGKDQEGKTVFSIKITVI